MSTGFRIFLLIVAGFLAVYVYRYRSPELSQWLRVETGGSAPVRLEQSFVSPVDRVLDPDVVSLARLVGDRLPRLSRSPGGPAGKPMQQPSWDPPVLDLPAGVDSEAADLPMIEAPPDAEGAPEEGTGMEEAVPPIADEGPESRRGGEAEGVPEPDPSAITAYDEITYTVKEGESLWRIAAKTLGSGARYREISDANRDVFPDGKPARLPSGAVLKIRVPVERERLKPPSGATDTSVEAESAIGPEGRGRAPGPHTVRRNENSRKATRG